MSNVLLTKKSDVTVTIFIDSHMAVGSYNWLSAARIDRQPHARVTKCVRTLNKNPRSRAK